MDIPVLARGAGDSPPSEQEFTIEKNVPLVELGPQGWNCKYPFDAMEVGDSFVVGDTAKQANAARSYASHRRKSGKTEAWFTVRKTPDGCYRCWRVA